MMQKIGVYTFIRIVGKGAFGQALLVEDEKKNRYICKLINTAKMRQSEIETTKKEVQVLMKLTDAPHIVTYRNAFTETIDEEKHYCIVMDFCAGGDMGGLIKQRKAEQKPFSEKTLKTWFLQLTLALHHMHGHKIIHRDLKPANIFLDKHNCCCVGDFGLSKTLASTMAFAKTYCGTPAYMAPELISNRAVRAPADIWALGCIIYEAATFQRPFVAKSSLALNQDIVSKNAPKMPNTYSTELAALVEQCLDKDPDKRPSTKEIIYSDYMYPFYQKISKLKGEELLNVHS